MSSVDSSVGQGGDFAKGPAGGSGSVYDTTPSGLGMNPAYLAGGAVASASVTGTSGAVVALGSFPPASPSDGQMVTLELPSTYDPVGGKKIRWNLIYNNADAVWDFIGGPPLYAEVQTQESTASLTYAALATAGPSIALPRAGDYIAEVGAITANTGGAVGQSFMSYAIGGTGAVDGDAATALPSASGPIQNMVRPREHAGLSAVTLAAQYRVTAGTSSFADRWMRVVPVRVT